MNSIRLLAVAIILPGLMLFNFAYGYLINISTYTITPTAFKLKTNTTDTDDANSIPSNPPVMKDTWPNPISGKDHVTRMTQVDSKVMVNPDTTLDGNVYAGFSWQLSATGTITRTATDPQKALTYWDMSTLGWIFQYVGFGGLGASLTMPYTGISFSFDGTGAGELSYQGNLNILTNTLSIPRSGTALNFNSFNPLGIKVSGDTTKKSDSLILDYALGATPFTVNAELLYQVTGKASAFLPTIMQIVPENKSGDKGGYLRTTLYVSAVPLPGTLMLMIIGAVMLLWQSLPTVNKPSAV